MSTLVRRPVSRPTGGRYLVFGLGMILLVFSWYILYFLVSWKTEALLVPWHFEGTWDTRPAVGTVPRTINDFFGTLGRDVPFLVFVLVCGGILAIRARRSKDRAWLPLVFFLANVVLVAADLLTATLSWSLSDWAVGPRIGIDAGYHRTWYGIVATCVLWGIFWAVLIRLPLQKRARLRPATPECVS